MKKLLLIFFVMLCLLTSCSINNLITNNNLKCFQTLNNSNWYSNCLAWDCNNNVCYIVSFWNVCNKKDPEMFYDGKILSGEYVIVGTYSYTTRQDRVKTVQAIMSKKEFYEQYNCNKERLKQKLDILLSYTAIK